MPTTVTATGRAQHLSLSARAAPTSHSMCTAILAALCPTLPCSSPRLARPQPVYDPPWSRVLIARPTRPLAACSSRPAQSRPRKTAQVQLKIRPAMAHPVPSSYIAGKLPKRSLRRLAQFQPNKRYLAGFGHIELGLLVSICPSAHPESSPPARACSGPIRITRNRRSREAGLPRRKYYSALEF